VLFSNYLLPIQCDCDTVERGSLLLCVFYFLSCVSTQHSAFLPQSKVYSVQTRLVSGKVEALVTRLLPYHFHQKWIPAEPKDWRHLSGLNSSI